MTTTDSELRTNYVSKLPAGHYASLYREHELHGAHVIMLGPGNDEAAKEACRAWPGGLQVGGGITDANARQWIERGAEKVYKPLFYLPSLHHGLRAFLVTVSRNMGFVFLSFTLKAYRNYREVTSNLTSRSR